MWSCDLPSNLLCPRATIAFWGPHVPRLLTVDYTFNTKETLRNIFSIRLWLFHNMILAGTCVPRSVGYSLLNQTLSVSCDIIFKKKILGAVVFGPYPKSMPTFDGQRHQGNPKQTHPSAIQCWFNVDPPPTTLAQH